MIKRSARIPLVALAAAALGVGVALRAQTSVTSASAPSGADAIIVGAGIAGLSAAWELAQGGAQVVVVDMASVFGGHAVMATGDLCLIGTPDQAAKGIRDTPEIAYQDFVTWGEDPHLEWVRYYVHHNLREIYDWVTAMGVSFETIVTSPGNSAWRMHRSQGRGLGLVTPIYRATEAHPNIAFIWNTKVDRLLTERNRVTGVSMTNVRTGTSTPLRARAVILATGGFQSNLDLVREHWPEDQKFPENILIGSGINSVGSGLEMARHVGARIDRLDHQWNYLTGLPDRRFPGTRRGLNARNYDSFWVNAEGRRFLPEHTLGTKKSMEILLRQKNTTYWAIFDEAGKSNFWVAGPDWSSFSAIERHILRDPSLVKTASSIRELAAKAGLPPATLVESVQRYNEFVEKGVDEDFGRFGPGRTYQPKKVMTPPFYAVQFVPLTRKSMGGVVIDLACRALDATQHAIPGLYAAGEVTGLAGINGKAGLEGTFLGPSIVTGRIAGRTVLQDTGRTPSDGKVPPQPAIPHFKPDPLATTNLCLRCHDLPKLITEQRSGYWHFDKVHAVVVAKQLDCIRCHAELTPTFDPGAHRINRLAQTANCTTCHQGEDR